MDATRKRRTAKYQQEIYFAGWRHNLADVSDLSSIKNVGKKNKYEVEEYFRVWRRNFFVRERSELTEEICERRKRRQLKPGMMPEKIFNEWLHNFHVKYHSANKYGSLKRRNGKKDENKDEENLRQYEENNAEETVMDKSLQNKHRSSRQRRSKKKKSFEDF